MLHAAIGIMTAALISGPAPRPAIAASDLEFLAGTWRGAAGPMVFEETWLPPRAGNLTGTFRMTAPDDEGVSRVSVVEIMTITEDDESGELVYRLRHFDTSLVPWASEADGPIQAVVTLGGEQRLRFHPTDPEGDIESFEYAVEGETLTAIVNFKTEGREPFELVFRRVR